MKPFLASTFSGLAIAGLLATSAIRAADKPAAAAKPTPEQMAEMMKKAEAAGTPGAAHKVLEPLVGDWTAEVKMWMEPGTPPQLSKGTSKSEWTLNGRFVQDDFNGEMMGKPFHGMGLTGYDNFKQRYTNVWVDDMSTAIMTSEGAAEDGGKVIKFTCKMDCPMTGEKDVPMTQIVRILSRDKHVFEMHDPRQGENSKVMEITYTRK